MTILYFLIALGILVLAHEWGHFIIARRSGIRVEQFSIGFGPKIAGFKKGETEYRISLLPLGGYVKLFGEDPVAEAGGDAEKARAIAQSPDAFSSRPLRYRLATVFAGPVMNIVLCLLFLPAVFMIGRQIPAILEKEAVVLGVMPDSPASAAGFRKDDRIMRIGDEGMKTWSDVMNWIIVHPEAQTKVLVERRGERLELPVTLQGGPSSKHGAGYLGIEPNFFWGNDPVVGFVTANAPAHAAGLKEGDRIVSIDDKPVSTWTEMTDLVRGSFGKPLKIVYERGGEMKPAELIPVYNSQVQGYVIGITKYVDPGSFILKRYPFARAFREGMKEAWKLFKMTSDVLGRLFTFRLSYKSLGGPIQIAQASGMAAQSGLGEFIYFLAFLSLQLGVLNLLPIPVLDGGHVFFMVVEGIRRKPVSLKVRHTATMIGFAFLMTLMLLITFNDIDRIWGVSEMWGKMRGLF